MQDDARIPAGMKAWAGGDRAPDDWDGGPVLVDTLDGLAEMLPAKEIDTWRRASEPHYWPVIAYTPTAIPVADESRAREVLATAQSDCGCRIPAPFDEVAEHAIMLAFARDPSTLGGGGAFLSAIHERTPTGQWIAVQQHPDGDWSIAEHPLPWLPGATAIPPAQPVGREAIARIIDPGAWMDHTSFSRRAVNEPDHVRAKEWLDAAERAIFRPLAKADAILALTPPAPDVLDASKYDHMDTDERALAMADDCVGDAWELLGYFREKLRQSQYEADHTRSGALKLALELRDAREALARGGKA